MLIMSNAWQKVVWRIQWIVKDFCPSKIVGLAQLDSYGLDDLEVL